MIDENDGALFCNQCFNSKNSDGFAALQWLNGWDFAEALKQVAEHLGIKPAKSKS